MKISMIISTFNRANLLARSLERLSHLTLPDELIVIDDGGTDNTKEVCEAAPSSLPIQYLYNDNPGSTICSKARNIGVKLARNEWIVTSEPELIYRTDVLQQFRDLHEDYSEEIVSAGKVYFAPEGWVGPEFGNYAPPQGAQEAIGWVAPYTGLWKKEWLMELGGWDEEFPGPWGWDDIDLLTRLRINGHGQHIDLGVEGIHQFHGIGGDVNFINEAHFFKKSFTHGQVNHQCTDGCPQKPEDLTDLIANRGHEWGKIKNA